MCLFKVGLEPTLDPVVTLLSDAVLVSTLTLLLTREVCIPIPSFKQSIQCGTRTRKPVSQPMLLKHMCMPIPPIGYNFLYAKWELNPWPRRYKLRALTYWIISINTAVCHQGSQCTLGVGLLQYPNMDSNHTTVFFKCTPSRSRTGMPKRQLLRLLCLPISP